MINLSKRILKGMKGKILSKSITTLKADIEEVLRSGVGWTKEISEWVGEAISKDLDRQLEPRVSKPTLRMSNLGTPCIRKLYLSINEWENELREELPPNAKNKFIYGNIIEAWTLGLVKASGHKLEGIQDQMQINGIKGSRDCVIDGMLFDVKSVSTYGFDKFKDNGLYLDDPFGYLSQLSSYLYAGKDDPLIRDKTHAGFLAVDKQLGTIAIDIYDLSDYLRDKEEEVEQKKAIVNGSEVPPIPDSHMDIADGKSGNMKLCTACSYCEMKFVCRKDIQTYLYSGGPRFLTKVVREPGVFKV